MIKKIIAIILVIMLLILLFIAFDALGFIPVAPINSWTRAVGDGTNPISFLQQVVVNVPSGATIILFVSMRDCTANTNMGMSVADNGANVYTQQASTTSFPFCGTVDNMRRVYTAGPNANATTLITVTQTNPPPSNYFGFLALVMAYSGVFSLGPTNITTGNSAFPHSDLFPGQSNSWAVHIFSRGPGGTIANSSGQNAGTWRAYSDLWTTATKEQSVSGYDSTTGGTAGDAYVCGGICALPNFAVANNYWAFGIRLDPNINPAVTTLPATNIRIDSALLNGNITDVGPGPTVNAWFSWGDTPALGNNTSTMSFSSPSLVSQQISPLNANHTYYFRIHAENSTNSSRFADGATLNFTTTPNFDLEKFVSYGWTFGFLAALILAMIGAYYIKRKRNE